MTRIPLARTSAFKVVGSGGDFERKSDAELIRNYARCGCADSFREIVFRYGSLVFSVCRRNLGNDSVAEDAFQETFIVLATRVDKIRSPEHLSSWLYGVALRVARAIHRRGQLATGHIVNLPTMDFLQIPEESGVHLMLGESIEVVLNEELDLLPDEHRAPLVLCYFMGETHSSAAQKLDIPVGSMSQRLRAAKRALQVALCRRGVVAPIVVLGWLLSQLKTTAPLSAQLVEKTLATVQSTGRTPHAVSPEFANKMGGFWQGIRPESFSMKLLITFVCLAVFAVFVLLGVELTKDHSLKGSSNAQEPFSSGLVSGIPEVSALSSASKISEGNEGGVAVLASVKSCRSRSN